MSNSVDRLGRTAGLVVGMFFAGLAAANTLTNTYAMHASQIMLMISIATTYFFVYSGDDKTE